MVKTAGKPKGKATAYNCFVKSCFDQHAAKYPNEKVLFTEVSAKCGEKWKEMDEKQKAIFVKMAAADEKRYNSEMAHYNAAGGSAGAKGTSKRGKKAAKDPNKPKRPTTAYFYFANEKREEVKAANPQWKVTEIAKELGRLWQQTSAEEKRRYEKMNERDKIRYEKEMEEYNGGGTSKKSRGQHAGAAAAALSDDEEGEDGEVEQDEEGAENGGMDSNEAEEDESD